MIHVHANSTMRQFALCVVCRLPQEVLLPNVKGAIKSMVRRDSHFSLMHASSASFPALLRRASPCQAVVDALLSDNCKTGPCRHSKALLCPRKDESCLLF